MSTIIVDKSGTGNTDSIKKAIDMANIGDTIQVYSGTYTEFVVVHKKLNLLGINTGSGIPIIESNWIGDTVVLTADGITISNFRITNPNKTVPRNQSGIATKSNNNYISNNEIYNNSLGISITDKNNNIIVDNNIHNTYSNAIDISNSSRNTIDNNIISNSMNSGISIYNNSNDNNITTNNISSCVLGIFMENVMNNEIKNNNTIYNISLFGIYMKNVQNNKIMTNTIKDFITQSGTYGIYIQESSYNNIYNNTIYNIKSTSLGGDGIYVFGSSVHDNVIELNNISDCKVGISVQKQSAGLYDTIKDNTTQNNNYGLSILPTKYLKIIDNNINDRVHLSSLNNSEFKNNIINADTKFYSCSNINVIDNDFNNSRITFMYTTNSNIYLNNFINCQISDNMTNNWDNGSQGNYYGTCIDSNNDGICDSPKSIPGGGSVDRYPLSTLVYHGGCTLPIVNISLT